MVLPRPVIVSRRLYASLLWLYPPRFRQEYGREMVNLFADTCRDAYAADGMAGLVGVWARSIGDLLLNASLERGSAAKQPHVTGKIIRSGGHEGGYRMAIVPMNKPSAWVPLAMSLAALAVVIGHIAFSGAGRTADEGTAAHLFQLLMAAQIPVVACFAILWLPRTPKQALLILAVQGIAILAACAPVFFLNL